MPAQDVGNDGPATRVPDEDNCPRVPDFPELSCRACNGVHDLCGV